MAKAAAKTKGKAAPPAKSKGKGGGSNRLLIIITLMALVPFSLPTMMVLLVGLLPTLGAALSERGKARYAWICVGGVNFAGLSPWLFKLWFGHHTLEYAFSQITGVTMLLAAYGASAVGWLLYISMPPIVGVFSGINSKRRMTVLVDSQKKLIDQWGAEVTSG